MGDDSGRGASRRQRADGLATRQEILRSAVSLATVDGLEGLSIGHLADALQMSKSGVYAHFGSKQELQLACVTEAARIFQIEVVDPALAASPGLGQLLTLCDSFFDHLRRRTFPGGCFFTGASLEMGTRPGPVKDRVAEFHTGFVGLIRRFTADAIADGQLPSDEDADSLAFEIAGMLTGADIAFVLHGDEGALDLASTAVHRRLGAPARR